MVFIVFLYKIYSSVRHFWTQQVLVGSIAKPDLLQRPFLNCWRSSNVLTRTGHDRSKNSKNPPGFGDFDFVWNSAAARIRVAYWLETRWRLWMITFCHDACWIRPALAAFSTFLISWMLKRKESGLAADIWGFWGKYIGSARIAPPSKKVWWVWCSAGTFLVSSLGIFQWSWNVNQSVRVDWYVLEWKSAAWTAQRCTNRLVYSTLL